MSFYTADHRIIKIKKEFQEDFYNLYNCNYDKIQNKEMKEFVDCYFSEEMQFYSKPLKEWSHYNEVDEWVGKYPTEYRDGIFSYSFYYNHHGSLAQFYLEFEYEILPIIAEEILEKAYWQEES